MPPAPTSPPPDAIDQPAPNTGTINMEPEEGGGGWYIPRPALCRNDTTCTCSSSTQRSIQTVNEWLSPTPSSNTSTQSSVSQTTSTGTVILPVHSDQGADVIVMNIPRNRDENQRTYTLSGSIWSGSSGSLLLTAANLAGLRLEPARKDQDVCSIASSTHFTMVNYGNARSKERKQSCCAKHTVSALVLTVCALFLAGLIVAIYYLDMRTRSVKYSR